MNGGSSLKHASEERTQTSVDYWRGDLRELMKNGIRQKSRDYI